MKRAEQIMLVTIQIVVLLHLNTSLSQNVFTVEIPEGRTLYDLQSNSSSFMLEQNPLNANELHAVFMVATTPYPNWTDRNCRYFYSTNNGSNWEFVGPVTQTRSGFPSIDITSDNRAVISAHSTEEPGIQRTYIFVDLAPGVGSWMLLNPGTNGNQTLAPIWPVCFVNKSNNQVIWAASQNGLDSCFVNVCTNISQPPGTFVGYKPVLNGETAGQYSVGAGTNGNYGIAYITLSGGAEYRRSTNSGQTWEAPITIWTWQASDSMGVFRGIDITFQGTTPQVVFGVANIDPVAGSFHPNRPSKIMFWSPSVNSGNPVKIDSAAGLTGINNGDLHVSVSTPVLGNSVSGNFVYTAYSKARIDTGITGNNYFDIYVSCSPNGGGGWSAPFKITNSSGPLRDCRHPSISNKNGFYNSVQAINVLYQSDSVPGSNINNNINSWAKMMFARVTNLSCIPLGVNTGAEIPASYTLKQNYPNPFNPVTQIEFSLPVRSHAKLTIYNALGEAVAVILNDQLSVGNYKVDWDASAFPSGVYFYELKTEGFTETRKMVFVK